MLKSPAEMEAKQKADKKEGFARFMDQPATRMMMSMIPASDKPEVLETLLQETFSAGYAAGGGQAMGLVIEALFKGVERRQGGGDFPPLR